METFFLTQSLKFPEEIESAHPFEDGRHAQGGAAAVGQAVETDAARINKRQASQPIQQPAMLGDNEREERELEGIGLPLQRAELLAVR